MAPCIEWTGYRLKGGYGYRQYPPTRRRELTHRIAYMEAFGPIPPGMCVCHRCDNPPCINPEHLFLGTLAENCHDRHRKGRTPQGEAAGPAKLTAVLVREIRGLCAQGWQQCDVAAAYGVTDASVFNIRHGKTWAGVA